MLVWHVDYWDRLGWVDPFGHKAYTQRQRRYSKAFGKGMYTPQFLVGNTSVRGKTFWQTLKQKQLAVERLAISGSAKLADGKISASYKLEQLDAKLKTAGLRVTAVLFQRKAATQIPRGENRGKRLQEYFIVRQLAASAAVTFDSKGLTASFSLPQGIKADNLGVAVLVEDPSKMRTLACRAFDIRVEK